MNKIPKLKVAGSSPVTRSHAARNTKLMLRLLLSVLLLLLFAPPALTQDVAADETPIAVLSYRWSKDRRAMELVDTSSPNSPQPAMIPQNKNFQRNARINDPAGVRDWVGRLRRRLVPVLSRARTRQYRMPEYPLRTYVPRNSMSFRFSSPG